MPHDAFRISSQTRANLRTFKFVAKPDIAQDIMESMEKENLPLPDHSGLAAVDFVDPPAQCGNEEELETGYVYPSTPATRLPLADLIGNTEDAFNRLPTTEKTPVDHIVWQHGPMSSDPSRCVPPASRTKTNKKRARSTSPSSSQNETSDHFQHPSGSFDLQHLSKHLKTPQNDPASELWDRYADGNIKHNGEKPQNPAIANLLSSPQTPGKSPSKRNATGLQRSASCGMGWPMSKAKRRRIEAGESVERVKDIFAKARSELLGHEKSKSSKVSLLVEKIQESLHRGQRQDPDAPSSSSPLPERSGNDEDRSSVSPLCQKTEKIPGNGHELLDQIPNCSNEDLSDGTIEGDTIPKGNSSSEFGDMNLDVDLLEAADAIEHGKVSDGTVYYDGDSLPHSMAVVQNDNEPREEPAFAPITPTILATEAIVKPNNFDDFEEDDDDDAFVAGLEELAAKYDNQTVDPEEQPLVDLHVAAPVPPATGNAITNAGLEPVTDEFGSDDEFGEGIDLEDMVALEQAIMQQGIVPSQGRHSKHSPSIKRIPESRGHLIDRYVIKDIRDEYWCNEQGKKRPEQILYVFNERTKEHTRRVRLRQSWLETPCTIGSFLHVIGKFDQAGQCIVDDAHNMIILHPDHLISATIVADSFTCVRRAVLQERVKSTSDASKPTIYGNILHQIFQEAMTSNRWDLNWLRTIAETVIRKSLDSLFEVQLSEAEAMGHLMSKMPDLQAWAEVFVAVKPQPEGIIKDRNGLQAKMSINKLLEVEEHIWSPQYGLKGNIDATVQVVMQDGEEVKTLTVPFELKTGRNATDNHRAQTALYTLLLSDRYDIDVVHGILYYLESSDTFRITGVRNEIQHMIIQRNELACFVRNRLELPPMLKKPFHCDKCYAKTACFVYHKLAENGDGETSGMAEKFDEVVKHLKPTHQEFFKKWDNLLTKEEGVLFQFRKELWAYYSYEREALGRCFDHIAIEPGSAQQIDEGPKINRFHYTFFNPKDHSGFSFAESQINLGDPIVISDESGHLNLASGYVTRIRSKRITVAVDRKLHNARIRKPGFDAVNNQSFTGIMEVVQEGSRTSTLTPPESDEQILYRLDKDEFSNGMATVRNNLIRMMEKDLWRARELRELIVEGKSPTFKEVPSTYALSGPASQANLNVDQKKAIEKVMSAKDYALVLGMPGTGKTTTIAHIIRALVAQKKSVLLTSYTHTAVDNILLKIRDDKMSILRLGAIAKIHNEVQQFADLASVPKNNLEELKASYEMSSVVATTCLGVNHPIFNERLFDYCIVDEASQITLPVCLGPIRMAKTFILVGDHFQLPPLVQNKEAQEGGLDVSLFKFLSESQPSSVVTLEHQYRMCADIMYLSNTLIYSGQLKCGTQGIADRTLTIPNPSGLQSSHYFPSTVSSSPSKTKSICVSASSSSCWLSKLLSPSSKVVLANTDPLLPTSLEVSSGSRITNALEAVLLTQYVESLIACGVSPREIGVITFYRSQLSLLKHHLRHRLPELEMHTADKFQGRDKEIIVLSCVRSNEQRHVGDLLRDWRRVNVSITRARSKLVIFGSMATLAGSGVEVLKGFVDIVQAKRWVVDLPPNAAELHFFEDAVTQGTGKMSGLGISSPKKRTAASLSPVKEILTPGKRIMRTSPQKENVDPNLTRASIFATSPTKTSSSKASMRSPAKTGKGIDPEKLFSGGKRPVLRDVINDIRG